MTIISRQRDGETDRQTDRDRETETDRETEIETELNWPSSPPKSNNI